MNNTRKRSSMMVRLVAVLAVTMMFTMCFVGGTFAKYTSSGTGTDSATVAKWSFKVGETDIATTDTFTFDLFKTVTDTHNNGSPEIPDYAENDISTTNGRIIAPGTQGSFALVLTNASQVTAQYAIDYTVTNTGNIPVQFSVDGGTTWTNDLADVAASDSTKLAANSGTTTIKVQWKWDFNGSDDSFDTALGIGGNAVLTVKAEVTATQVD